MAACVTGSHTISHNLLVRQGWQLFPLGLRKDCFKYLRWAFRPDIFHNSYPIHEKLLKWDFPIAYVGGSIWQPDREKQIYFFLGDALSPKYNCFVTRFFYSLKVEKFLAAITVELAKDTVTSTVCQMNLMRQILGVCKRVQLCWQRYSKTDLHLQKVRSNMFYLNLEAAVVALNAA